MAHFIDPQSNIAAVLNSILEAAGGNFKAGYDATEQPYDVAEANSETLIQYDLPAGAHLEGHANPAQGGNVGAAIHSLLMLLAPSVNAYSFILPILGIIRGIIEVLCAILNPFALGPAMVRLFTKWIPSFLSLFPPVGGIVLLISTIKAIMALIYYILTELIPTLELIITNINTLAEAFQNRDDLVQTRLDTIEFKMKNLIKTLLQKIGIMSTFKPILDIIFLILRLLAGFPCASGFGADTGLLPPKIDGLDSTCCDEFCPDILSDRSKAPSGQGIMLTTTYGDCAPVFVFQIITNNPDVALLEPYQESFQDQLACMLGEPLKVAIPSGSSGSLASYKVEVSDINNGPFKFTAPVLDINGGNIKVSSPLAFIFSGQLVNYRIIIDYDVMIMRSVIGIGCHPDVRQVKDNLAARFPMTPVFEANPEAESIQEDYGRVLDRLQLLLSNVTGTIDGISQSEPPFDDRIAGIQDLRDQMIDLLNNFIDSLTNTLDTVLNRNTNRSSTTLEVDKNIVTADNKDFAIVTVTPRDLTGSLIAQNIPNTISVNVEILTTLGTIDSQEFDNSSGTITAILRSSTTGTAEITAKINNELITTFDAQSTPPEELVVREVRFVSDAILPTRRVRSKPSRGKAVKTGSTTEKEPGGK